MAFSIIDQSLLYLEKEENVDSGKTNLVHQAILNLYDNNSAFERLLSYDQKFSSLYEDGKVTLPLPFVTFILNFCVNAFDKADSAKIGLIIKNIQKIREINKLNKEKTGYDFFGTIIKKIEDEYLN